MNGKKVKGLKFRVKTSMLLKFKKLGFTEGGEGLLNTDVSQLVLGKAKAGIQREEGTSRLEPG